jgi:hypothetical protein
MDERSDRDDLAGFLSRFHVGGRPLTEQEIAAAVDRITGLTSLGEAELLAHGFRFLTVVHGPVDSDQQQTAVGALRAWTDRNLAAVARVAGTGDSTTWTFTPAGADDRAAQLEAVAREHDPGWWEIRRGA